MANNPALPNVATAVGAWSQVLDFVLVGKEQVDFMTVERLYPKKAFGVRAPLKPQELAMKPEGERSWRWESIHASPNLQLGVDDIIIFDKIRYRVMSKNNYQEYGYVHYEIVEDYKK